MFKGVNKFDLPYNCCIKYNEINTKINIESK